MCLRRSLHAVFALILTALSWHGGDFTSCAFGQEPAALPPYGQPADAAATQAQQPDYAAAAGAAAASGYGAVAPADQRSVTPITPASGAAAGASATPPANPALVATPPQAPPAPPFQLSELEQQNVYRLLKMWEDESSQVKTFHAKFGRLDYDAVWGSGPNKELLQNFGVLSYSKPDKGSFKIDEIYRWEKPQQAAADQPGEFVPQKDEVGEHWVCDGKAVYEYDHRNKQLVVTRIPEQLRGQAIADGPLPFLFGAQADKLVQRYWIREKQSTAEMIWIEAYPRWQADAANYDSVEVMLDRKTMQPKYIQVKLPGGQQRHVYEFREVTVNGKFEAWFGNLFNAPRTPLGWKRVVLEDGPAAGPAQAATPQDEVQR
jgi:TIGR03009 family protein